MATYFEADGRWGAAMLVVYYIVGTTANVVLFASPIATVQHGAHLAFIVVGSWALLATRRRVAVVLTLAAAAIQAFVLILDTEFAY